MMLVVLAFGVVLDGRMPGGEHFSGQPFGFWTSPQDRVRSFEPHLRLQKGSERMMAIYLIGPPPFRPYLQLNANRRSRVRQRCQPLGRVSQSDTDREESPLVPGLALC